MTAIVALEFLAPHRLWLLLVVALLAVIHVVLQRRRTRGVVRFTNIDLLDSVAPSRPGWRRHVVAGIHLAALAAGVVAIARPITTEDASVTAEGRIVITFDVSLSMQATDIEPDRFEAAKEAALSFVDAVDPRVEIGLISFSGTVRREVAPTLDRRTVERAIDDLELGEGTAIGEALVGATRDLIEGSDEEQQSVGAIVLLSDGETTVGRPTAEGAAVAAEAGIPVYAIAFGTASGSVTEPNSGEVIPVPVNTDELSATAETTGGEFYAAATAEALEDAYDQIGDDLSETLGEPEEVIVERTWVWAAAAIALMAIAWLLGAWWLRGLV
jgi:Ca-activated chloride channel homolog